MGPDRDDAVRLRRDDLAGLTGLMARHQDRLFRYLLRLLRDQSVAEDVFQETWLRVAERISRYDASRPFAPWLLAIGRHLAVDHLRRYRPESLEQREEEGAPEASIDPGPLSWARSRERQEMLAAAIDALPLADREVLALRFEQDLALSEVAEVLGGPLPTAKARLYRALARLRRQLLCRAAPEEWR